MIKSLLSGKSILFCIFIFSLNIVQAQESRTELNQLQSQPEKYGLKATDVADVQVQSSYLSQHNGVTHTWIQQQQNGIPIFNALIGLHSTADGQMYTVGHRFVQNAAQKTNTNLPALTAQRALEQAMVHVGFKGFKAPALKQKISDKSYVFEGGAIAKSSIEVSAVYVPMQDGNALRLAWMVIFDQANTADVWNIRIDAITGEVLEKNNRTVYCKHEKGQYAQHDHEACVAETVQLNQQKAEKVVLNAASSYKVYALPTESPVHGAQTVVTNPENLNASPYGWHDTNGAQGAEYTITRGNNVFAYEDLDDDDAPPAMPYPDGGAALNFNFNVNPSAEPAQNIEGAIVNLFYMNNMMHDIFYEYGFDEAAGNFQENNYGNGGAGSDGVNAEALDGGGVNNANFSTPSDGGNGRMQMYTWSTSGGNVLQVNSPGSIIGGYQASVPTWGGGVTTTPVTGDLVIANDGTSDGSLGCQGNSINYSGKIVMVDRGSCQFGMKALNVQQGGGKACIICNFDDSGMNMGAGDVGGQVTIPVVGMIKSDCDIIRNQLGQGINLTLVQPTSTGPAFTDGDLDNGIIAHEYGHGISNRLTGGGNNADCLGNAEQMGEGWSDWFSLVTTVKTGDTGAKKRGVGAYVEGQGPDGRGIRRYPYSTDMSVNPITFATVAENTEVHALGEVWTAVTWDLYWALVDKYGYSDNLLTGTAGNNRAIQLVMDGMALQPCSPGFIDGRNAILLADKMNYNGEDTCLIHEVFARRGFGYLADQVSSNNAADGVVNFDPMPFCIKELKISKACTPIIKPNETATFTINVKNHMDITATGVVVKDILPAGLTYVGGSATNGGIFANGVVTWQLDDMPTRTEKEVTYQARPAMGVQSLGLFQDGMEDDILWLPIVLDPTLPSVEIWGTVTNDKVEGDASFFMLNSAAENDIALEYLDYIEVTGVQPVLRFWTKYDTESGADAGFVEITNNDGLTWFRFGPDDDFRNGYPRAVQYSTLAIPFLQGFSGNSDGWKQAYFDMSAFAGQTVRIRYHWGADDNTAGIGWWVDQTELIDMVNFNSEVCVTSNQSDNVCATAIERGLIIDTNGTIDAKDASVDLSLTVRPNPVVDVLSVAFVADLRGKTRAELYTSDGRLVLTKSYANISSGQIAQLDMSTLPAGAYILRILNADGVAVRQVVKR